MKVWGIGTGAGGWLVGIGYCGVAILNPFFWGFNGYWVAGGWGCS